MSKPQMTDYLALGRVDQFDVLVSKVTPAPKPIGPITSILVPNQFPRITSTATRIAIVGDFASATDEEYKTPFSGSIGKCLDDILSNAGVARHSCFLGNIVPYAYPDPDEPPALDSSVVLDGLTRLTSDLAKFQPNIIVLMGRFALNCALGTTHLDAWRGSYFVSQGMVPFFGKKCIATFHPRDTFPVYERTPLVALDFKKAKRESTSPFWEPPTRNLITKITPLEIVTRLHNLLSNPRHISIDIEGYVNDMSCISVADSPTNAFIIPFTRGMDGNYFETVEDECMVWRALSQVLADARIPKILQNSLYDRFVLQYSYNCCVVNTIEDTMLKHWELFCELEKSLAFLCSIYTDQPYYKSDRKSTDRDTYWRYCCTDSAVTYEIAERVDKFLDVGQKKHYRFDMDMLLPFLYMELRGIKYDVELASKRLTELNDLLWRTQYELDTQAGFGVKLGTPKAQLIQTAREIMCYKKDPTKPKKQFEDKYNSIMSWLTSSAEVTEANIGEYNIATKLGLNLRSPEFKDVVYRHLKLPIQYIEDKDGNDAETTNYKALLRLAKSTKHPLITTALGLGALRTRAQMLHISADPDGRVRCGYNVVGTETGRLTCYTSPTGSGYNLQTIPSKDLLRPEGHPLRNGMRDIFVADPGYYMFQCDLSGADGWTVAANLAALGDTTMFDDYKFGIKPAKVLCYLMRHGAASLHGKSRAEIKQLTAPIKGSDWDYFASKVGQHGTSYLMGPKLLSEVIFVQSEGAINLSQNDCKDLQKLFNIRYKVTLWHNAVGSMLKRKPVMTAASGHRRRFFGRYNEILGQALAHEPQANTTYATNMAALALWNDPENRLSNVMHPPVSNVHAFPHRYDGDQVNQVFRIEPLHQVHDALLGQFKIEDTDWAVKRIKQYFNNPMTIAGITLVIPFEGNYGTSWGNLNVGEIESC